jgi:protein-S-isoprenylcysteine O-methyltransferase Ste14
MMIGLVHPELTSVVSLAVIGLGLMAFIPALLLARGRAGTPEPDSGGKRDGGSMAGVVVQSLGFAAVGFGPVSATLLPQDGLGIGEAAAVIALTALTISLFLAASRAMGRNWAIVARTRGDHELVTWGPFAAIRNPIYTALFAWLLAMAVAFGHWRGLILGVPLYWIGTWMRVSREETLLRAQFGTAYDAYAARVKRFIPGLL